MRFLKYLCIALMSAYFSACASPPAIPVLITKATPILTSLKSPTPIATSAPSAIPLASPTAFSSMQPTAVPISVPTPSPTPGVVVVASHSPAPSPTVTPTVTPTHAPTAAPIATIPPVYALRWGSTYSEYDCTASSSWSTSQWQTIRKYIDITDRGCLSNIAAAREVGIISGEYTDPNLPCTATASTSCNYFNEASNYSSTSWARTCSGQQIFYGDPSDGHNTFTDPRSATLPSDLNAYTVNAWKAAGGAFILVDNVWYRSTAGEYTGAPGQTLLASSNAPYCGYTTAEWVSDEGALFNKFALPVMFNGDTDPTIAAMTANSGAQYGMCEDCISFGFNETNDPGRLKERPPFWNNELDAAIVTQAHGKKWLSFVHGYNQPETDDVQLYLLASLLLVYQDGQTGLMMDGNTPSNVNLPPEVLFVPTQPLKTASGSIESLAVQGAYLREFKSCSFAGAGVGPCAAIVNPSPSSSVPMPVLTQKYAGMVAIDNWCGTATTSNLNGSYCYKGAIKELGDTGSLTLSTASVPASGASIPPATAYILTGNS